MTKFLFAVGLTLVIVGGYLCVWTAHSIENRARYGLVCSTFCSHQGFNTGEVCTPHTLDIFCKCSTSKTYPLTVAVHYKP